VRAILPDADEETVNELRPYLEDSFGNATRIDYGTGHETAFIAFLCCLHSIAPFQPADLADIGLRVFPRSVLAS